MNKKKIKSKKPRTCFVLVKLKKIKVGEYWLPTPFDKKRRLIPSSVDCCYNAEYFSRKEAISMMETL